ncbi:hypothetical protein [Endozoicomonas sp. ONNA2]|uniref:hypothetical protein n=1 Tax=Endozoicomonas sp. ONNA2 TaxID=2828741 RepID=UPI002147A457|nr:hypothetical protein [Endozoicomonas sp. ONNA2]
MDPVNKRTSPSPGQHQPRQNKVPAASAGKSYHGRKTTILQSGKTLFNKLIFWLKKSLEIRNIKVHFANNRALSTTSFNQLCNKLLQAIIDGKNKQLPTLLDNLRLSLPAEFPGKKATEIETDEIMKLFERWSAQFTDPALANSLREDLRNPESNIRKTWTSQRALLTEVNDFSLQTYHRLNDIEVLIGNLAINLFPDNIEELMQAVTSCENETKSSHFYQQFTKNIIAPEGEAANVKTKSITKSQRV